MKAIQAMTIPAAITFLSVPLLFKKAGARIANAAITSLESDADLMPRNKRFSSGRGFDHFEYQLHAANRSFRLWSSVEVS